ncbi:uncharacterized protein LOC109850599 [Asparagus officinalis]|uniref:uncharacterized protein LOC109850599 n=1 Tax=Asparagus officinalis TaxID=4686 RepID=UPI00098DFB23|nr:uncharacterized protein LOC109850599 [Asparagus officinalis]
MYPRVKVRQQEEPPLIQKEEDIVRVIEAISLKSHSPRIRVSTLGNRGDYDSNPPHAKSKPKVQLTPFVAAPKGKQNNTPNEDNKTNNNGFRKDNKCQSDFHLTYPRIHESHPKDSLTPSPVQSKGTNDDRLDEDNKTNIRASSVPMPRAVLSSPDNDELIGSQNQSIREKQTPLRRQTLKSNDITSQQSQLSREKITLTKRPASSPKTEGQTKIENTHSTRKSCTEKGKGSSLSTPKQRPPFKVGFSRPNIL